MELGQKNKIEDNTYPFENMFTQSVETVKQELG